jgi:flagellar motor switch protein FliG
MEAMTRLGAVAPDERDSIVEEFERCIEDERGMLYGGINAAKQILESAVGPERASRFLEKVAPDMPREEVQSFKRAIEGVPPASLAALLADEHPQVIALLATNLSLEGAAQFVAALPRPLQGPVAARLAQMEEPSPVAIERLTDHVLARLKTVQATIRDGATSGPRRVADILGRMRRSKEDAVVQDLERDAPDVAQKVNQYRITVEQIIGLDGRVLQRVLREVDGGMLPILMKGLDDMNREVVMSNMSERAADRLREELENQGPVKLRDIETAQHQFVNIAKDLAERGEIVLREEGAAEEEEDSE